MLLTAFFTPSLFAAFPFSSTVHVRCVASGRASRLRSSLGWVDASSLRDPASQDTAAWPLASHGFRTAGWSRLPHRRLQQLPVFVWSARAPASFRPHQRLCHPRCAAPPQRAACERSRRNSARARAVGSSHMTMCLRGPTVSAPTRASHHFTRPGFLVTALLLLRAGSKRWSKFTWSSRTAATNKSDADFYASLCRPVLRTWPTSHRPATAVYASASAAAVSASASAAACSLDLSLAAQPFVAAAAAAAAGCGAALAAASRVDHQRRIRPSHRLHFAAHGCLSIRMRTIRQSLWHRN